MIDVLNLVHAIMSGVLCEDIPQMSTISRLGPQCGVITLTFFCLRKRGPRDTFGPYAVLALFPTDQPHMTAFHFCISPGLAALSDILGDLVSRISRV